MKATATPAATLPDWCYVCVRCGLIVHNGANKSRMCTDCKLVEADLADPKRIAELDRRLDPPVKTHCANGHEYTPESTSFARGWIVCLTCKRESSRRSYARRKAAS